MKKFIVAILLSFYGLSLGAMQASHPWIYNPGEDTDDNVSMLILDAAQHDVALETLKMYLETKPTRCLELEKIPYRGDFLKKAYGRLQQKDAIRKKEVRRLLRECTLYTLIKEALAAQDPHAFDAFTSYFDKHVCDIDKVLINPLDETDGYLGELLSHKPSLNDFSSKALAYSHVYTHVQPYRSQPDGSEILRDRIDQSMDLANDLTWLNSLLKHNSFNIDLIYKEGNSGETLGAWLESKKSEPDVARILALDRIKNFRMATLLTQRIKDVLEGRALPSALGHLYALCPVDIDTLERDPATGKTISALIHEQLSKPNAFALAKRFQGKRTDKQLVFRSLFTSCENEPAASALLEEWFTCFPCDIDKVPYDISQPRGVSCGDRLDDRKDKAFLPFLAANRSKVAAQAPKNTQQKNDENLKKASWLLKNRTIAAFIGSSLASIALYFYLRTSQSVKHDNTYTHPGVVS